MDACLDPENLASADHLTGLGVRTNRVRVYIVTSLAGGTGSGMFLDLAYTVRALLKQAGVDIRVCGQGLIGRKIEAAQVNPDVQIDLWAMTTLVNLQLKGYVRVG